MNIRTSEFNGDENTLKNIGVELLRNRRALKDLMLAEGRVSSTEDARLKALTERGLRLVARGDGEQASRDELMQRSVLFRVIRAFVKAGDVPSSAEYIANDSNNLDPEASVVIKAAVAAATSSGAGWAAEVVSPMLATDFVPLLRARSALFQLVPNPMTLGAASAVNYPKMASGSASGFVGEGQAIPVKADSLTTFTVLPYKLAGLVVLSNELMKRADQFTESAVLDPLAADCALGADTKFLSADAATTAAPAGLFHSTNAANAIAATAGANAQAAATDLHSLFAAGGNMRRPALLLNPTTASKALQLSGAASYPLIAALATGRVLNADVILSGNVASTTMALVDRDDLIVAGMDGLRIDVSQSAVIHMDTSPDADVLVPASGGTSLFQRDMVGIAMKVPLTWRTKRTAAVQRVDSLSWA